MEARTHNLQTDRFENYISLGYFCEVAKDLERLGLRNQSSPFDWVISYFPSVIDAIDKEFSDFLEFDNLSQNTYSRAHYHEDKYHIYFFHDFSAYQPLASQYCAVKDKYDRRIKRFLNAITKPTLFVRYISSEERDDAGKSVELKWIEENYEYVLSVLKRFNTNNEVLFIGDDTTVSKKIKVYHVPIDDGDRVSRQPIFNNIELFPLLSSVDFPGKENNIKIYTQKQRKRNNIASKILHKIHRFYEVRYCTEYHHTKVYGVADK